MKSYARLSSFIPRDLARPVLLLCLTSAGCASYRYDVETPDATPMTVRTDQDLVVPTAPARLRLRQAESRCVVLIENPTGDEITLDGNASAVVDPLGQSHAINTQLVPPGAFVKLIVPPLREQVPGDTGFHFGLGVLVDSTAVGGRSADPTADGPRKAQYLDTGKAQDYWEWSGEGRVRLILAFKQKDRTTRHEIVLRRQKQ